MPDLYVTTMPRGRRPKPHSLALIEEGHSVRIRQILATTTLDPRRPTLAIVGESLDTLAADLYTLLWENIQCIPSLEPRVHALSSSFCQALTAAQGSYHPTERLSYCTSRESANEICVI